MTLKFKPDDFNDQEYFLIEGIGAPKADLKKCITEVIAQTAQQIFDEWLAKEGKVVYGKWSIRDMDGKFLYEQWNTGISPDLGPTSHKAILINIEPIEKCNHPKEKVHWKFYKESYYEQRHTEWHCECGARVQPESFIEVP